MGKKPSKSRPLSASKPVKERIKSAYDYTHFKIVHANKFIIATAILAILLLISVFKNISYPLFWADESMTAMGTERVLEYGYPKVHDGKNVFYDLRHSNPTLGIDEKDDAYVGGAGWAQYYFGIIGYKLAEKAENIFTQTGIFRATFAIIGLLGVFLFGFFISRIFQDRFSRYAFLSLYILLELLSVSLALLIREVRYYSLVLFLVSIILGLYSVHRFYKPINKIVLVSAMSVSLWLLFNTFAPVYFILLGSIGLTELIIVIHQSLNENLKTALRASFSVLISLAVSFIAVFPLLSYFRTFEIAKAMNVFNNYTSEIYWGNVKTAFDFFKHFDLLWIAILFKVLVLVDIKKILKDNSSGFRISSFLTLFFIVFIFFIARIPNFIYTRYIIYLQPVLAIIIALDFILLISTYARESTSFFSLKMLAPVFIFAIGVITFIAASTKDISGHVYELTHAYKGPLDYTIPFLKEKYPTSDTLVIAANYEETSYMYYLKSKVIVGFTGNNLSADSIVVPHVIAYRKTWSNYGSIFNKYLQAAPFDAQTFPVKDIPVNNIPELNFKPAFNHHFRMQLPDNDKDQTYLFLRK
ncbi:MAG: hypothetical protein IPP15_08690 [Saprospiraceae bacterium]|uniref:Glycosyltransferase RgtA/B/C/D-like domain-containing protein n=1 Tax=Candidatus Opimibacter skivensis TaxID=2982028 RepID=A0A9D7SSW8_9BACT|nr:hypothetical protein [Candidatus Opimibacter skivensis]